VVQLQAAQIENTADYTSKRLDFVCLRRCTFEERRGGIRGSMPKSLTAGAEKIDALIHEDTFHERKAAQMVKSATPEKTMLALQEKLPEKYWVKINRLLRFMLALSYIPERSFGRIPLGVRS
jgi:endonuclease III